MARSIYNLAARSHRRRRIAMSLQLLPGCESPTPEFEQGIDPAAEDPKSAQRAAPRPKKRSNPLLVFDPAPDLRERLLRDSPMTWIFAGDSDFCSTAKSPVTFPRIVADRTKTDFNRPSDIFVNATHSRARIVHAQHRLETRLAFLKPDVVTVVCGFADCLIGQNWCAEFENSLIAMIECIHASGATPVVCTPPHFPDSQESQALIDRLIYIEAIRGCVAEHSGILVDHWQHWENLDSPHRLWNHSKSRPKSAGIVEMQRLFLHQIGFDLLQDQPRQTASNQTSISQPRE